MQVVPTFSSPRSRWLFALAVCVVAPLVIAEFCWCVFHCDNDFLWHRFFGIAFLDDEVYETFGEHYLPARAMIDAATAWIPYRVDRVLWLLGTCAALAWCVRFWLHASGTQATDWRVPALIALVAVSTYIHRDLAECGLQLFLLGLLTVGLWALVKGRPGLCGAALGLATVYKVTPAIFLPYLLWKRQWKAAGWTVAATAGFCLLPVLFLGWHRNAELHGKWLDFAIHAVTLDDPSQNGVETPNLRNQSLPLLLARLVQDYPAGHPLHLDGPVLVHWAGLDAHTTKRVVQGELLVLALAFAWRMRRAVKLPEDGASLADEWAVVCIFVALLSPLCWLQHLVLVLPASIIIAQRVATRRAPPWQLATAGVAAAFMLLVHRDLLGVAMCDLLSSFQPHAVASLLLAASVLGAPRPDRAAAQGACIDRIAYRTAA